MARDCLLVECMQMLGYLALVKFSRRLHMFLWSYLSEISPENQIRGWHFLRLHLGLKLSVESLILTALLHVDLINVAYLTEQGL